MASSQQQQQQSTRTNSFRNPAAAPNSTGPQLRSSSGRYRYASRDESEMSDIMSTADFPVSGEFLNPYTVHIPPTPDNQPMNFSGPTAPQQASQQFVSNAIFTGGYNAITRGHIMEKHPEHGQQLLTGPSTCGVRGCDQLAMRDEQGNEIHPCECGFSICKECFIDAVSNGGICPGCKEVYKEEDEDDERETESKTKALTPTSGASAATTTATAKADPRRLGSRKNTMIVKQSEFDHAKWLFETKGTYGYGNAHWPPNDYNFGPDADPPAFNERSKRPLARKSSIPAAIISPYRFLVLFRMVVLVLFLMWRVRNPNRDAVWLWGMSVACEIWFAFSWLLDQLPKLVPVNRHTDLEALKERFEKPGPNNPKGRSDLPGVDLFVSTADPEKEPPLVTANTILSILAAEYPVEKTACYLSDDGGALLTFEALAEAASFAQTWVPFCRKHVIEPRNPETYFALRGDPTKNKSRPDFVKDRRRVKREYDEFKVRINGLPEAIRRRSDAYNAHEEIKAKRAQIESGRDVTEPLNIPKATWMSDGTHWPGTWTVTSSEHGRGDHAGIIQVMLAPPSSDPILGTPDTSTIIDTTGIDTRLPMLVYVSREKRPGYDHNKKAGAMNALVRASAIMSNGAFILNLDCDHYIYNALAIREAMCFMMDRTGDQICYVQFPQRFEGIDPNDRYANHNSVFFDVNMRALDGIQGPVYVGTGCCFRRTALYGFDPPRVKDRGCCGGGRKKTSKTKSIEDDDVELQLLPKRFGNSAGFAASVPVAEFQGRPLAEQGAKNGRPPGALLVPREPLDATTVAEAIHVISCFYEGKTEWGQRVGWIYGSVTEDVVTGFRMHNRGWRSVYCVTKVDAFHGTAPINLTDRLHQVLRWATGSVEIFFSRNNALFANTRLKFLQRIAYLNVGVYPFTSIFLVVYCFLPALSLFTGEFIVQTLSTTFLVYLFVITLTLCLLAVLEIRWSGITLDEWWRNEQFWLIGGTSAHLVAVLQGLLKVVAGIDISFTLTSKAAGDEQDVYADLYIVKWSALMIPPITIMLTNLIAIAVAVSREIYSEVPRWSQLLGGVFFSFWVLCHLYPFAKGLMGRKGRAPTIVFVWAGLLSIIISLLWVSLRNPSGANNIGGGFQFP
ncbi:cellulose synthase-like D1-2, glycosyltransferase family 2 protein [Selaginella moellendorffii]|uniref:Cellulose synthase-like D1-2, glycosyltransferase family 2 protein n=1 Tax=Selaginella moellendorffii TaxID=88036 RepID=D8R043_SELML|nr:cellulose synthase-like protein D3 [Selaginella moellendorffii]EFJ34908.1 cellulose synthase-like D1-2, glycosyltransferase family 2 protein [Selaginella moellendorffii]|eukprot:XP_002964575.1 cellulose synthase-like protein D3 [Selaginella moellendorffii]